MIASQTVELALLAFATSVSFPGFGTYKPPVVRGTIPAKRYLYVSDYFGPSYGGHAIWRYPLQADGMPKPDADLTLDGGMQNACCLALDSGGHLFVSDQGTRIVNEFQRGANGDARPIRQLAFGSGYPDNLGVDQLGYLYVEEGFQDAVEVFAPGAHGNDPPIHTIINWNPAAPIGDIVVDGIGRLFVAVLNTGVYVYDDPANEWQEPTYLFQAWLPQGYIPAYYYVTLDEPENQIYASFYPKIQQPWDQDFDHTSFPANGATGSLMFTKGSDCKGGGIISAIISGKYLLGACVGTRSSILVYRKDMTGRQHLLKTIGSFISPGVIRIGP
jgi:hypothetical protein